MMNNSEKVYKFVWVDCDYVIVRPSTGYISPGEEKDLEVIFYSSQPIDLEKVRNIVSSNMNYGI